MRNGNKIASRSEMFGHLVAGAGLGAALAAALLASNSGLATMLAGPENSTSFVVGFMLLSSSIIAVGSGITGFILSTLEKN